VTSPATARAAEDDLRDCIQAHQDRLLRHALHATGRHPSRDAQPDVAAAALATAAAAQSLAQVAAGDTAQSPTTPRLNRYTGARIAARSMWLLLLLGVLGAVFADRGYVAACAAAFSAILAWQTWLLARRAGGPLAIVVCGAGLTASIAAAFIPGIALAALAMAVSRVRSPGIAAPDPREDLA
jgi:hypothetical protein